MLIPSPLQIGFVTLILSWSSNYLSSTAGAVESSSATEGLLCFEICNVKVVRLTEMHGYTWNIFISSLSVPQENLKEVSPG